MSSICIALITAESRLGDPRRQKSAGFLRGPNGSIESIRSFVIRNVPANISIHGKSLIDGALNQVAGLRLRRGKIEELQPTINPIHGFNRPGPFEMKPGLSRAILDVDRFPEPSDVSKFGLIHGIESRLAPEDQNEENEDAKERMFTHILSILDRGHFVLQFG